MSEDISPLFLIGKKEREEGGYSDIVAAAEKGPEGRAKIRLMKRKQDEFDKI